MPGPCCFEVNVRTRPDREDYAFILILVGVLSLFWFAYAYQACGVVVARCMFNGLKDWQTLLTGILTLIGAIVAGAVALRAAGRQISAATEQYYQTIRPFVIARLSTYAGVVFMLEIENIGNSAAENLKLDIDKDFFEFGDGRNIKRSSAFTLPIAHFAPREKFSFYLSQGFNMDNKKDGINRTPPSFTVSASYSFRNNRYDEKYLIDTQPYNDIAALKKAEDHLQDISNNIAKIAKKIQ